MAVRRVLAITIFLLFVAEAETIYGEHWISPFGWAHTLLFTALPYKIRLFDHITALCLFWATRKRDGRGTRVAPMRNALIVAALTIAIWFVYGLLRGGDARAASWQTYLMMSGILFAFSIAAAFRTPEHYTMLGKALLWAAAYRAIMCWIFYFSYVRNGSLWPIPEFITSHDDTVLWVVALLILAHRTLEPANWMQRAGLLLFSALLVGAIQFNTRRLAWVSLMTGILTLLLLMPRGRTRRRVGRIALVAAPLLALYVAVGWDRPERVFKPLQALATVTTEEDASTKARNAENLGLIVTARTNYLLGTGWGHRYIALTNKYSIAQYFELWPYVPHNSILGLLAFTGVLGFCGYWLAFPTAMFLNARLARGGDTPAARRVGLIGAAQMVVCANQMYGDMGLFFAKSVYVLSASYAIALRLPIGAGVWANKSSRSS